MKVTRRQYSVFTSDEGFEFSYEPLEDTIIVEETDEGYTLKYLSPDSDCAESPDEWASDELFLVHYHRDFQVKYDSVIVRDELAAWYNGEHLQEIEKKYHIYPVSAYIHSGIHLSIGTADSPMDAGGWDTSHVGAVLVDKKWGGDRCDKVAEQHVQYWNQYLSGDIYGIVKETYTKNKERIEADALWQYFGWELALTELEAM